MPAMAAKIAGSTMIAGDEQDIGIQGLDGGNGSIKFFNALLLAFIISIFATAIRLLLMNEEKVVAFPMFFE